MIVGDKQPEAVTVKSGEQTPNWTIVTQVKSNRVVYFTDDPTYEPHMSGDWYYCSTYIGLLPNGMSLRNCWGWRFNGGIFRDAREHDPRPVSEKLLDANKRALQKILREKIEEIRRPYQPSIEGGHAVRERKLTEAISYLGKNEEKMAYPFLQAIAISRKIGMAEAAKLVIEKSNKFEEILLESERFREQLSCAINGASDLLQLEEVRHWLIDAVYPELLLKSAAVSENTTPQSAAKNELDAFQISHEKARLRALLREEINKKRSPIQSLYVQNDAIRIVKLAVAQKILLGRGLIGEKDQELLTAYANSRGLGVKDAAKLLVSSKIQSDKLLFETEIKKDAVLSLIENLKTRSDIAVIEKEIGFH